MTDNMLRDHVFGDVIGWLKAQRYTLVGTSINALLGALIVRTLLTTGIPALGIENILSYIPPYVVVPFGALFALLYCVIFFILFQWLKFPRTPSNRANIYIAIYDTCETEESQKFLHKLYKTLEVEIARCDTESIFSTAMLRQDQAKYVISRESEVLMRGLKVNQKKSHLPPLMPDLLQMEYTLLIYGKLVFAQAGAEETFKIEPNYVVRHRPILIQKSNEHSRRFDKFIKSQNWTFPKSKEMEALSIVPDNLRQHILFAIGMSAHYSGFFLIAIGIHRELLRITTPQIASKQYLLTLQRYVKDALIVEYRALATYYAEQNDIEKSIAHHQQILELDPNDYYAHINLAALYYRKDPSGSTHKHDVYNHIESASKHPRDASFKLSKAFLMIFWENQLGEGIDLYIHALRRGSIDGQIIRGTYDFLNERRTEKRLLINTLMGLIDFYRLNKGRGVSSLSSILGELQEDNSFPELRDRLQKILP